MVKNNGKSKNSKAQFEEQYVESVKRGAERLANLPKAVKALYDARSGRLVLDMQNGVTLLVPVGLIQGLQTDDETALADFELRSQGSQIHWLALDVQFYVEDLLKGVFGTPKWMQTLKGHLSDIGRKGGSSKSEMKSNAARENGKKGGRPARKVA